MLHSISKLQKLIFQQMMTFGNKRLLSLIIVYFRIQVWLLISPEAILHITSVVNLKVIFCFMRATKMSHLKF